MKRVNLFVYIYRSKTGIRNFFFSTLIIVGCLIFLASCNSGGCKGGGTRGPYFLYGLQWGMTFDEVKEVLKTGDLKISKSAKGERISNSPFFIAGVPGQIELTFKKPFLWKPVLKKIKYTATIATPGIRAETYYNFFEEMKQDFGDPAETTGQPEIQPTPQSAQEDSAPPDAYSALWRHRGGDIKIIMMPKEEKVIITAEANVQNPDMEWMK